MKAFMTIFWIHQAIFWLVSVFPILDLITKGGTSGQLNLIPLLLAWIAGSLTWGFGFVMAERTKYPAESRIQVTA
jgi:4-hydroxybenzoate polyprenyltransferase